MYICDEARLLERGYTAAGEADGEAAVERLLWRGCCGEG